MDRQSPRQTGNTAWIQLEGMVVPLCEQKTVKIHLIVGVKGMMTF